MRRNTGRISLGLCLLLLTAYSVTINPQVNEVLATEPFPTNRPVLFIDPDVIERDVSVEFTVSVKIFNLTDNIWTDPITMKQYPLGSLYGIGMNLSWDPTVLEYVGHLVKIPVEDYADGVLYYPTTEWENNLNIDAGWYKMAYSSQNPAPVFNNPNQNNTVFEITFRAKKKGSCDLLLTQVALSGKSPGQRIFHEGYETDTGRGAVFSTPGAPVAKFNVWPTDLRAGLNKPVKFNASESYDTDGTLIDYMWDFGDGSTGSGQIINHTYTSTGIRTVTLKVRDNEDLESRPAEKSLRIVQIRDVAVKDIDLLQLIKYGSIVEINVTVSNKAGLESPESFSVSAYYNTTSTDGWTLIGKQSVVNLTGDVVKSFSWNTSDTTQPPSGSYFYRVLVNAAYVPHEANATDNSMITTPVEVTAEDVHDASATISSVAVEASGMSFNSPFILGENVTVRFRVRASGTVGETYNITLRIIARNGTELLPPREWTNEILEYGNEKPYGYSTVNLPATYCNITLKIDITQVDKNPANNYRSVEVRVVKPPVIEIDYPENVYVDESATFDATASLHQDPDGQITTYTWDVRGPGDAVYGDTKEGVSVDYIFDGGGSWTLRLRIVDGFGLGFDPTFQDVRPAANAYRRELTVNVQQRPGVGSQLPIDPLYIVAGIIIVAIVAVVAYRVLRKPKLPE